jgi:hypothetical protein
MELASVRPDDIVKPRPELPGGNRASYARLAAAQLAVHPDRRSRVRARTKPLQTVLFAQARRGDRGPVHTGYTSMQTHLPTAAIKKTCKYALF